MYNLGLTGMYTTEDAEKAKKLIELLDYFSDWPPRKYTDEDALEEAECRDWSIIRQDGVVTVTNTQGEELSKENSILGAVNKAMKKSKGWQFVLPAKEIVNHGNKTSNT